jgi:hypothetical protein
MCLADEYRTKYIDPGTLKIFEYETVLGTLVLEKASEIRSCGLCLYNAANHLLRKN